MAQNKSLERATKITLPVPAAVKSGDPVMVGSMAGVMETDYNTATGNGSVDVEGAFFLQVLAGTVVSPLTGAAIKQGDKIYASGGSTDSTTNVLTGFTLSKVSSDPLFGFALDALPSGTSGTIRVRLKVGA